MRNRRLNNQQTQHRANPTSSTRCCDRNRNIKAAKQFRFERAVESLLSNPHSKRTERN